MISGSPLSVMQEVTIQIFISEKSPGESRVHQGLVRKWLGTGLPGTEGRRSDNSGVQSLTSCREGKVLTRPERGKKKTRLKEMMSSAFKNVCLNATLLGKCVCRIPEHSKLNYPLFIWLCQPGFLLTPYALVHLKRF